MDVVFEIGEFAKRYLNSAENERIGDQENAADVSPFDVRKRKQGHTIYRVNRSDSLSEADVIDDNKQLDRTRRKARDDSIVYGSLLPCEYTLWNVISKAKYGSVFLLLVEIQISNFQYRL